MSVNIVKKTSLTNTHIDEIKALIHLCNQNDDTKYVFDDLDDFKKDDDINAFLLYVDKELIGFISIFAPRKTEAELIAFIRPNQRQYGYFNKLLFWQP